MGHIITKMIYLICGPTGAGKTSYAIQLANKNAAIRFTIDEWMTCLFSADMQKSTDLDWMLARLNRCERQIWALCQQILKQQMSVVLDLGLAKKVHRDKFRHLATTVNVEPQLHYISADPLLRRQRVKLRNENKDQSYAFEVTDAMFDFMESWFEPPENQELSQSIVVNT